MNRDPHRGRPIVAGFSAAVPAADEDAAYAFSHDAWTAALERFVDDQGRVDYRALAADPADLDRYLASLARFSPDTHPELFPTPEEALAYYLNAYNAYIWQGVLDRGPEVDSVWRNPIAAFNFFVVRKVDIGGEKLHLKGLEDRKVRARFRDPRAHAVLNCASISCPRMRRRAIEPATLDQELDEAMREMVSDPRHFRLDDGAKTVYLSKIFDWFDSDFLDDERRRGARKPNLIDYVNRFRSADAQVPRGYKVRFLSFDKGLNRR